MYEVAELIRKLETLIVIGSILKLDFENKKIKVNTGSQEDILESGWIPWPAEIGKNFIRWRPLRLNTQVILVCPSGDIGNAKIVGMLYSPARGITPPTNDNHIDQVKFEDGTVIQYNSNEHCLSLNCVGDISIKASTVSMEAKQINIVGPVKQTGGDMTSDGISAQEHVHTEQGDGEKVSKPE